MGVHVSIPGSSIATRPRGAHLEEEAVLVHGTAASVPVLYDVLDRLLPLQPAVEQAVYVHLYRLSIGAGRNVCRVSHRELSRRAQLSPERLRKALAGLIGRGHLQVLHRDSDGTTYRVRLPHQVFNEAPPAEVDIPDAGDLPLVPRRGVDFMTLPDSRGPEQAAESFLALYGDRPGRSAAEVAAAVQAELDAGQPMFMLGWELADFAEKTPRSTPMSAFHDWVVAKRARSSS